jgi:hypothetical protein
MWTVMIAKGQHLGAAQLIPHQFACRTRFWAGATEQDEQESCAAIGMRICLKACRRWGMNDFVPNLSPVAICPREAIVSEATNENTSVKTVF